MSGVHDINRPRSLAEKRHNTLAVRRIGIDTQQEAVVFMRKDCHICRAEGFFAHSRIRLTHGDRSIIATLYQVTSDIVGFNEAAFLNRHGRGSRSTMAR